MATCYIRKKKARVYIHLSVLLKKILNKQEDCKIIDMINIISREAKHVIIGREDSHTHTNKHTCFEVKKKN